MRNILALFSAVVVATLAASALPADRTRAEAAAGTPGYRTEVSVDPSAGTPGVYQAKVTLAELETGKLVALPSVEARMGEAAEVTNEIAGGGSLKFRVNVDRNGGVAEYAVTVSHGNDEVAVHTGKVRLSR